MFKNISDYIVEKNNQYIVALKPAGLQSVNSEEQEQSLQSILSAYVKHEVYPVHRIDQPVYGLMLFAMSKKSFANLSAQMVSYTVDRKYIAIVDGKGLDKEGILTHYLRKSNKDARSFAFDKAQHHTKEAKLDFVVTQEMDNYTVLSVNLHTGRHHQIRAQFSAVGHPIKGDVKYGFKRSNPDKSIDLMSWKLSFDHPVTNQRISHEAPMPQHGIWQDVIVQ